MAFETASCGDVLTWPQTQCFTTYADDTRIILRLEASYKKIVAHTFARVLKNSYVMNSVAHPGESYRCLRNDDPGVVSVLRLIKT